MVRVDHRGRVGLRGRVGHRGRVVRVDSVGDRVGRAGYRGRPRPATGTAGGALTGNYPNPTLNVVGGPCAPWQALSTTSFGTGVVPICKTGVYATGDNNFAVGTGLGGNPFPALAPGTLYNHAFGNQALLSNTTGSSNTAVGFVALQQNTSGNDNSALGTCALSFNTTGSNNSAFGDCAMRGDDPGGMTGDNNSALGAATMIGNTTGSNNTALGYQALSANTIGNDNVALGSRAGQNLTTGVKNIDIGANVSGVAGESSTIRIGNPGSQNRAFIVGVSGVTTGGVASPVLVDASNQLGTTSSSRRFKRDIHPLAPASRKLMKLNPISFRYKRSYVHGPSALQFGLLAEQVANVYPNLVVYGRDGRPSAIAYQELPALLLAQAQRQQAPDRPPAQSDPCAAHAAARGRSASHRGQLADATGAEALRGETGESVRLHHSRFARLRARQLPAVDDRKGREPGALFVCPGLPRGLGQTRRPPVDRARKRTGKDAQRSKVDRAQRRAKPSTGGMDQTPQRFGFQGSRVAELASPMARPFSLR